MGLAYPADGSVQGPCPDGFLYFGKPSCGCSAHDCRPDATMAAEIARTRGAQPPTVEYLGGTFKTVVFLFGAETTGGAPAMLAGPYSDVYATAKANGWAGVATTVEITNSTETGEEVGRRTLGSFNI